MDIPRAPNLSLTQTWHKTEPIRSSAGYHQVVMKPLGGWLKPPAGLLLILFSLTLVSVSALGWFGWKLLAQERLVEAQRAQERLEQDADRIVANLRGALAETGERLAAQSPGKDPEPSNVLRARAGQNALP